MRVFVLSTGRCGSNAFIKACKHIENYTADHEGLAKKIGEERFAYPDDHIEADNRLSWHLGQLNKRYGDEPYYVHLKRDKKTLAKSFLDRFYVPCSIIDSFCEGIRMMPSQKFSDETYLQVCYDYIDTVNSNIAFFLSDKTNVIEVNLENIVEEFAVFWDKIGAKGDIEGAIAEFHIRHNKTRRRKLNLLYRLKLIFKKEYMHFILFLKSVIK